jgi:hypothetical protein
MLISFIVTYLTSAKRKARKQQHDPKVKPVLQAEKRSALPLPSDSVAVAQVEINKEERKSI